MRNSNRDYFLTKILNKKMKAIIPVAGVLFLFFIETATISFAQSDTLYLNLDSAINMALEQNPEMRVATLEKARAQAKLNESRGRLLPSLNANGSYNRNIKKPVIFLSDEMAGAFGSNTLEIGSDNSYMSSVSLAIPLYNPAIYSGIEASRIELQMAGENYKASKIDLTYNVQRAWFDVLLARESLDVIELSFANAEKNLENIRKLHQQGLVAEFDLIRAEVQTENIRPDVLQAQNMYSMVVNFLKTLMGVHEDQPIEVSGSLIETSEEMLREFNIMQAERSLTNNPDLVNLGLQRELILQQSKSIRASGLPSINAVSNYNYQTESNNFNFSEYNWVNTIGAGFQVSIPIFRGFTTRNQTKQLEIGARQLQLQKDYLRDNLNVELSNILKSMDVAVEKSIHTRKNVELAQRGYDIALLRYNSGQGTLLEINDSEIALTRARFNLLQAKHELLNAKIQYDRFLGKNQ
jgi:outer membrane protein